MNTNIWENISRYSFVFLIFILPIFIIPFTVFPLELNKSFLFYAITLLAMISYCVSVLQKASFSIPKSILFLAFGAVVVVWLFSAFFSSNAYLSLIGSGQETDTVFCLLMLGVAMFLVSILFQFQAEKKAIIFYMALFASSLLVFILQFFQSVLNISILPWFVSAGKIANTVGSWNELGIFFGLTAFLAVVFLEFLRDEKWFRIFLFSTLAASLLAMLFINFTAAWIVLGSFLLIFLIYLFSVSLSLGAENWGQRKFFNLPVIILLVVIFFIMSKTLVGDFVSSLGLSSIEVRPTLSSTIQITKESLKENLLLGSGPNTFSYDWTRFKQKDINTTLFWSYSFSSGFGLLPSWVATAGILGALAFSAFLILLILYGIKIITHSTNEAMKSFLIASFCGSLYLWTFFFIYAPGILLMVLAFLMTGIFLALLCASGGLKVIEISFLNRPKIGFISSLVVVFLLISGVAGFYLLSKKYVAAYSFAKGIVVFNSNGDTTEADNLLNRATRFDPQDRYFRAISEIGLFKIQQLTNQTDLSAEELRVQFQSLLDYSIRGAQSAINVNPTQFLNWISLGKVYESIIPFKITGAKEAAINNYKEALKYAPLDPRPLFFAGRAEVQGGDIKSAKSLLSSTLEIKQDYAPAIFLLAQLEAQEGNIKEAIDKTVQTLYLTPDDIGVWFQLGLLYYQNKDFENGQLAFEKIISMNPSYSNARYFLGLIYEKLGKKDEAIGQFKKIKELNPDNQEVDKILSNLNKGKPILEGISPPQASPEKRQEPPVDETNVNKDLKR